MIDMTAREMECAHCGLKGEIDSFGSFVRGSGETMIFGHLGHDPFSGYLHYECPSCRKTLRVHPMDILKGNALTGVPDSTDQAAGPIGQLLSSFLRRLPAVGAMIEVLAASRHGDRAHADKRADGRGGR